jgi:hypothetical protein
MRVRAASRRASSSRRARDISVLAGVGVLTAVSLVGSAVSVATALSPTWWDAVGPRGRLSVPLPMNAALIVLAAAAANGRRPQLARISAWLVVVATTVAVVSGVFDGGYAAALTPAQRTVQVTLVLSLVATGYLAARRATAPTQ